MQDKITVYQNDKLYDINFTLKDANDDPISLSNASLLFKAQRGQATAVAFSGTMTVVSAADGTCKYTVADGDFASSGNYYGEIQVTYTDGKIITFGNILVEVLKELPRSI